MLKSPFYNKSKSSKNKLTIIVFILLILGIALMRYLDSFLTNEVAINGIFSFELAKDVKTADAIINSWDVIATAAAGYSLIVDFLFLIIYSLFIALLIDYGNEKVWKEGFIYKIGVTLIYAQFVAAFCDVIENIALLQLFKNTTQFWTSIAYYFATMKFILIALGILFILISWILKIFKR